MNSLRAFLFGLLLLAACGGSDGGGSPTPPPPPPGTLTVSFRSPAPDATGISRTAVVYVRFNKAANATTVNDMTFTLLIGTTLVMGTTVTYNPCNFMAQLVTIAPLATGTTYTANLSSGIQDSGGEALTPDTFSFTTGASTDTTWPTFPLGAEGATPTGTTTIDVNWTAATDDTDLSSAIVYDVFTSTTSGCFDYSTPTQTTAAGAVTATVSSLTSNTTYFFVVRAQDTSGNTDQNVIERTAKTNTLISSWGADVWPVIQANCKSCHTTGSGSAFFLMTNATVTRANWVGVAATCVGASPAMRVVAGDSSLSFVYHKISTPTPTCGVSMPWGQPLLPVAEQNKIRDWIDQGALNN